MKALLTGLLMFSASCVTLKVEPPKQESCLHDTLGRYTKKWNEEGFKLVAHASVMDGAGHIFVFGGPFPEGEIRLLSFGYSPFIQFTDPYKPTGEKCVHDDLDYTVNTGTAKLRVD